MRRKELSRKVRINNTGSFTVEATFVLIIIIGLIMALLFVTLYCFDRVNIECQIRNNIKNNIKSPMQGKSYKGVLGSGELKKNAELDFFCESYILKYEVPIVYPLSQQYVENQFTKTDMKIKLCKRKAADTIRMYDALKSEE